MPAGFQYLDGYHAGLRNNSEGLQQCTAALRGIPQHGDPPWGRIDLLYTLISPDDPWCRSRAPWSPPAKPAPSPWKPQDQEGGHRHRGAPYKLAVIYEQPPTSVNWPAAGVTSSTASRSALTACWGHAARRLIHWMLGEPAPSTCVVVACATPPAQRTASSNRHRRSTPNRAQLLGDRLPGLRPQGSSRSSTCSSGPGSSEQESLDEFKATDA